MYAAPDLGPVWRGRSVSFTGTVAIAVRRISGERPAAAQENAFCGKPTHGVEPIKELRHVRRSVVAIFCEKPKHQIVETLPLRQLWPELAGRSWRRVQVLVHPAFSILGVQTGAAGKHLLKHATERV